MAQLADRDTAEVMALLREAVTTSGLSQATFARALGTSAPRLSTYLTGDTRPSAQFLMGARRLGHALAAAAARGLMSAPVTAAVTSRRHEFTAEETTELLDELDAPLRQRGVAASIFVVGGAAIAANHTRRERVTEDVDALTRDTVVLEEAKTLSASVDCRRTG